MSETNCEQLVLEAEDATSHSLEIAAEIYESTAKCFDSQGNRRKAGQYLTIAGDFYLELRKMDKAAGCYGKAIVRHLMIEDIETAKILVEKGKKLRLDTTVTETDIGFPVDARLLKEKRLVRMRNWYRYLKPIRT